MFIIDESTIIKSPRAARTKICLRLSRMAALKRILTGSPTSGSLSDVWAQFEFLEPGLLGYSTFKSFQARYCVLREITVARGRTQVIEVGPKNIEELRESLKLHSIRRRKRDCLDLPEKLYDKVEVELTPDQLKAYTEMKRHAMTEIEGAEITTKIVITQVMRMHQIICGHITTDDGRIMEIPNNRVQALQDIIERSGERGIVIWCSYRPDVSAVVTMLRKAFPDEKIAEWHGGIPQEKREEGENLFQSGKARFMVATQTAGGRGRTWTAGNLVIYYSNNYDLELREQSEDRTHRIGQTGTVLYIDMVAPGTIDEKIIDSLREKKNIVRTVLHDGIHRWI
jgi:SNF2 family DNA or RNA helicase